MSDTSSPTLELLPYGDLSLVATIGQLHVGYDEVPIPRDECEAVKNELAEPNLSRLRVIREYLGLVAAGNGSSLVNLAGQATEEIDAVHRDKDIIHASLLEFMSSLGTLESGDEPASTDALQRSLDAAETCFYGTQILLASAVYHPSMALVASRARLRAGHIAGMLPQRFDQVHDSLNVALSRPYSSRRMREINRISVLTTSIFDQLVGRSNFPGVRNFLGAYSEAAQFATATATRIHRETEIGERMEWVPPVRHPRAPKPERVIEQPKVVDETVASTHLSSSPISEVSSKALKANGLASVLSRGGKVLLGKPYEFGGFGDNAKMAAGLFDRLVALSSDETGQTAGIQAILDWAEGAERLIAGLPSTSAVRQTIASHLAVLRSCIGDEALPKVITSFELPAKPYSVKVAAALEKLRSMAVHPSGQNS